MVALQGKNYIFTIKTTFMPINSDGCHVSASKTKKNVLITLQVRLIRAAQNPAAPSTVGCSVACRTAACVPKMHEHCLL